MAAMSVNFSRPSALAVGVFLLQGSLGLAQTPEQKQMWDAQRAASQADAKAKAEQLAAQRAARKADPMAWVHTLNPLAAGGWQFRAVAPDGSWPTSLGGVKLEITDSQGKTRMAPIYYVTTNAIAYLIPSETAAGHATVKLTTSTGAAVSGALDIGRVSSGLYSANSSAVGVAARARRADPRV